MKIVSLVPSITETLFDFGLSHHEVIGRTKFCIHPAAAVAKVPIIGGTKNVHIGKILALKPDLIIANKEENEKLQVEELAKHCRVWVTDISNLQDNANFLWELGMVLKKRNLAEQFIQEIDAIFVQFKNPSAKKEAVYIIWQNPLMTVGSDTFIHSVLNEIGFQNKFESQKRYPVVDFSDLESAAYILLSSEPFPFSDKHLAAFKEKFPDAKVILVDGEAFSWFGTHLLQCEAYLKALGGL